MKLGVFFFLWNITLEFVYIYTIEFDKNANSVGVDMVRYALFHIS